MWLFFSCKWISRAQGIGFRLCPLSLFGRIICTAERRCPADRRGYGPARLCGPIAGTCAYGCCFDENVREDDGLFWGKRWQKQKILYEKYTRTRGKNVL